MTYTSRSSSDASRTLMSVLVAGLGGALVDAIYFSVKALILGQSPISNLQSIAAFWLGGKAMAGGASSAALGAITHAALAIAMAAGLSIAGRRIAFFRGSIVTAGIAYGLVLYLVMYLVVLPGRWPSLYPRFDGWISVLDIAAHIAVAITFAFLLKQQVDWVRLSSALRPRSAAS